MMREPKTEPIPAPDPATPTVAAPAPMNLAAESMSFLTEVVVKALLACKKNIVFITCQFNSLLFYFNPLYFHEFFNRDFVLTFVF